MTEETKPTRGKGKKVLEREKETLLSSMRKGFALGRDKDRDNRLNALNDLKMLDGDHWDYTIPAVEERRADGRPCLTINLLPKFCDQVEGDQRANRPASKVHPRDSGADIEGAELRDGLLRAIKAFSFADVAYDTAFQHAVQCGFGYFRVVTEYAADDIFEQDIRFRPIYNNFAVVWDSSAQEWDRSDAMDLWLLTRMSKDVFKRKYPDANSSNFPDTGESFSDWVDDNTVTVAEWFRKEPVKKRLYRIAAETDPVTGEEKVNTRVVFEEDLSEEDRGKVEDSRMVETYEIWRYLTNGIDFLEDKQRWPASIWPVIPVWGKEIRINGKTSLRGAIRNAITPNQLYEYFRSTQVELVALSPKAPIMATAEQISGHEVQWGNLGRKTYPYVLVNPDPAAPGWPQRIQPAMQSTAVTEGLQISSEEMKSTTGLYDASLGARSNETSGIAIEGRQKQGQIGSFAFIDNLGRSIQLGDRLVMELLPKVYDTARAVRSMGIDGAVKMVNVNESGRGEGLEHKILNDLTAGKYDVTVTMGPSYTTQRQESADSMLKFIQADPTSGPLIADLLVKNMDWPGAQEIAHRLRIRVPPQALTQEERDDMAKNMPQEQPQEAPPPDPRIMIEMEKLQLAHHESIRKDFETQVNAIKTLAEAEAKEQGQQLEALTMYMKAMYQQIVPGGEGQQGSPGGSQGGNGGQPSQMPPGGQMIPGRAVGGPVEAGQPYTVGERGPEVMVPQQDGVVIPNQYAKAIIPQVPGAPEPSSLHDRLFPPAPTPEQVQEMLDAKFLYWDESGQSLVDKEGNTVYRMDKGERE